MKYCTVFLIFRITITTQGKTTAISSGAIPKLVQLVNDSSSEVRLNTIKAITTLSESPDGREELLKNVEDVSIPVICQVSHFAM